VFHVKGGTQIEGGREQEQGDEGEMTGSWRKLRLRRSVVCAFAVAATLLRVWATPLKERKGGWKGARGREAESCVPACLV
jgi:hypothetical protein